MIKPAGEPGHASAWVYKLQPGRRRTMHASGPAREFVSYFASSDSTSASLSMAAQPPSFSEEVLAQLSQAAGSDGLDPALSKAGPLSTRRGSHSTDMPPRALVRLRSIDERPFMYSRRSSVISNMNAPFSRKNSFCSMGANRRLSLGPWAHYGRVSFSGMPLYQPIREIQYENTYRTGPESGCRFNPCQAHSAMENILQNYLADTKYNPLSSSQLAQNLSDLIRAKLKEQCPNRYKMVCSVFLGQMGHQGVTVASRSLWDAQNDNFASATYSNATLFAVALVHGSYHE